MSDLSSDFDARRVGWWERRSAIRRIKRATWLTGADRDLRVQRARAAHSRGELHALTRDLEVGSGALPPQLAQQSYGSVRPQPAQQSYGSVPPAQRAAARPPSAAPAPRKRSLRTSLLIGGLVLLVTCGGGLVSCVSAIVDSVEHATSMSAPEDLLTNDGWNTMIDDLDQGIDIRGVVEVVVRRTAATVQLLDGDDTVLNYYYDGDINATDDTARNPARVTFDLTLVQGSLVETAVADAREGAGVDESAEAWVRVTAKAPNEPTVTVSFPGEASSYSLEVALDGSTVSEVS